MDVRHVRCTGSSHMLRDLRRISVRIRGRQDIRFDVSNGILPQIIRRRQFRLRLRTADRPFFSSLLDEQSRGTYIHSQHPT